MKRRISHHFLIGFALAICCVASRAEETTRSKDFVRYIEDDRGAQLQTGVASYRNSEGVTVDLISAIHVADRAYYEKLNLRFTRYEALLYEMVGGPIEKRTKRLKKPSEPSAAAPSAQKAEPDEASEKEAAKRLSWLSELTGQMEHALALQSQMAVIDYHKKNFVHADMSLTEFFKLQDERNEGFIALWLRAVKAQTRMSEGMYQPGLLQIMEILCRKDSATEFKRMVARTFDSVEMLMSGIEDKNGTVIITERNKVVMQVLQEQIATGKKKLGIFYGSGHLPDMEQRLLALGFTRTAHEWFTAWNLPPPPKEETSLINSH